jgi:hypothetical protein
VRVAALRDHVRAQLPHDRLVVPSPRPDEELDRLALHAVAAGDRFAGLALQIAEQAGDDKAGVLALLLAVEERQIPRQEARQPCAASGEVGGLDGSFVQQRLSLGAFEQGHGFPPCPRGESIVRTRLRLEEKRLQ